VDPSSPTARNNDRADPDAASSAGGFNLNNVKHVHGTWRLACIDLDLQQ
jgi:hypothetical protein